MRLQTLSLNGRVMIPDQVGIVTCRGVLPWAPSLPIPHSSRKHFTIPGEWWSLIGGDAKLTLRLTEDLSTAVRHTFSLSLPGVRYMEFIIPSGETATTGSVSDLWVHQLLEL